MTRKVHLKLVERFDEITKGARLFRVCCAWCGTSGEVSAVKWVDGPMVYPSGVIAAFGGWRTDHRCRGQPGVIASSAVAQRRVYLILDGAEDPEATETTAPKELESAR